MSTNNSSQDRRHSVTLAYQSAETSMDIGYTNKEPGKLISMLLHISVYLSLKRNNFVKPLFQHLNPIATTNLWKVTCMVQISFSFLFEFPLYSRNFPQQEQNW
jgi:hypothetical protein